MGKDFLYIFFSHTYFFPKILIFFVIYTDFVLDQSGRFALIIVMAGVELERPAIHSDVIGSAVAQSVELETRGEEVLGSIPAVAALCLLVGVSIMWPAETEVMVSPLCLMCGSTARKIVRHQSLDPSVINLVFTRTLRNQTKTKQNKIRFISIVQIFFPPEI